jgi:hypothetical protein
MPGYGVRNGDLADKEEEFEETDGMRCGCKRDNRREGWEDVKGRDITVVRIN